jgi:hypothetical protein
MSHKRFKPAATALAAALCALSLSAGAVTIPLRVAPPTLIAPINSQARAVPVIFQWNVAGSNGNVYGITVQNLKRGTLVVAQPTASYEFQIASAAPDYRDINFTRVLFRATTSATSYLFDDRNVPGSGFTTAVPPGLPLPGGLYYWRVRAQQPGAPFSQPAQFTLLSGAARQTPTHQLTIENLALGASPRAMSTTVIVATVVNTGTFPESSTTLQVFANGTMIAQGPVPALAPNQGVQLAAAWIPPDPGIAQLAATIDATGDLPSSARITRSVLIGRSRVVTTTLVGVLRRAANGDFELQDAAGNTMAYVVTGRSLNLESFVGRRVTIRGSLSEGALGLLLNALTISPAP